MMRLTGKFISTIEDDGSMSVLMTFDNGKEMLLAFPASMTKAMEQIADNSIVWSDVT